MTLEELTAKLPAELQPWAGTYGPVVIAWTQKELEDWLNRLILGDIEAAYRQILKGLGNAEFLASGEALFAAWKSANVENKAQMDLQKRAVLALLKVVLSIALAMVGL